MPDYIRSSVKTAGTSFEYMRFGKGKRPLVIIPGLSVKSVLETPEFIVSAFQIFEDDFDIWLFERRGEVPEGFTIKDIAEDEASCLISAGISKADLFGASLGGVVAQLVALNHPELVNSLVLASTTSASGEDTAQIVSRIKEFAKDGRNADLCEDFASYVYSEEFFEKARGSLRAIGDSMTPSETEHLVRVAGTLADFDITSELSGIRCPVLAVGATGDKIFGDGPSRTIAEKTGGRLYVYEGSSHALYDEEPGFRPMMLEFLKSV